MRRAIILLLLTGCAAESEPDGDDLVAEGDGTSGGGESSESDESSTGDPSCAPDLLACTWDTDADFYDVCLPAYFECDPSAEVEWNACTGAIDTCQYNCCAYPSNDPALQTCRQSDDGKVCIDGCGLYADCLPD